MFANPYYAAALVGALIFWVWPAFLYKSLDAHWLTVAGVCAALFFGVGKAATEIHLRFIAPRQPPRGNPAHMVLLCGVIVAIAWLTRFAHDGLFRA
jgi:hypothetical protein